jgi:hypothetical protein
VDITALADALQQTGLSEWMRGSLKALPIVEAVHVMAIATVYGTIALVDLRLLGIRDTDRPFTRVFRELVRWTWLGFAIAVVTGVLLFMPNARTYVSNTAFGLKFGALILAGINMAVFEFTTLRTVARWDSVVPPPLSARVAGASSLVLWTSVIVFGRWVGFTKGYDFSVPDDVDFDFLKGCLDCLQGLTPLV